MKRLLVSVLCLASFAHAAIPAPTNYALLKQPIYNPSSTKLNLSFTDAPLRFVLQAVGEHLRKGIVLSEGIQGSITLNLNDVSAEEALDLILAQKGLSKVDKGSTYLILSVQDPSFSEALFSQTIRLKYSRVSDLQTFFSTNLTLLSPKGSILYDSRSNSIVVSDVESIVSKVMKVIESIDIPLSQVEIEARIVQVSTSYTKDLGVKYGASFDSPRTQLLSSLKGSVSDFSTFGFSLISGSFNLDVQLDAMQKEGLATVISTPKIMTLDNAPALVSTGSQVPYQTSTVTSSGTTTNTNFKDALLSLSVTPSISPDGTVLMKLAISNDDLQGYAKNGEAILSKNQLNTQVSVLDGSTVVLGGVFVDSKTETNSKVPFFSSLRYINPLFKSTSSSNQKKELLIFLTPRIKKN